MSLSRCRFSSTSLVFLAFAVHTALAVDIDRGNSNLPKPRDAVVPASYESDGATSSSHSDEYFGGGKWNAGIDFVFVRPNFSQNVAFTRTESDGVGFATITDVEFNYDYALSPRLWVGYETADRIGLRATYFGVDTNGPTLTANPPANGFGQIGHPTFGLVDITSTIPTDSFSARAGLDLFSIDLEITKHADFDTWCLLASAGVRYASIQQDYFAQLRSGAGTLVGQIDYSHNLDGFGPTVAVQTRRPLSSALGFYGLARGSLLFGDGNSVLRAGEDLDLANPFLTTRTTHRNDLLPVGELQVGFDWLSRASSFGQFTARVGLEGQVWGDVGNTSSESGSLGLLGLTAGIGLAR